MTWAATQHDPIFALIAIPAALVFTFLILYLTSYINARRLEPLRQSLGGSIKKSLLGKAALQTSYQDMEVTLRILPGGKHTPPHFEMQTSICCGFDLCLTKENVITRGLQAKGICVDLQVGVPQFDDCFRIKSSEETRARSYLSDPTNMAAINQLFDMGFSYMMIEKQSIRLGKTINAHTPFDGAPVATWLETFQSLARKT